MSLQCLKFTGNVIKKFRLQRNQTQPQFARDLSRETGEKIDSKEICRLENYGQRDACHPMIPSDAVKRYICPCDS
jgi:hypothetical protein